MVNKLDKFKNIHIFDPCFGEMTGHWENYCKRLYRELEERGYKVKVFGQKKFNKDIVQDLNFQPVFQNSPFVPMNDLRSFQKQVNLFLADFNRINENEFQDGDLFVFHSVYSQIFSAIVEWTQKITAKKKVVVTILFQFPPSDGKSHSSILKKGYYFLKKLVKPSMLRSPKMEWFETQEVHYYWESLPTLQKLITNGNYHLLANTNVLARNFSALLNTTVHYMPMPGEKLPQIPVAKEIPTENNCPIIKIGYMGHSSLEKGGQFLWYLVQKTLQIYPHAQFVLHLNPNKDTAEYLSYFKQAPIPNVTCYYGHIEQEKMMDLIREVDIVLMPYSPAKYSTTPSAIFTEGMPLQKVFVIPEKTWIHEEAVKYSSGFVGFKKYNHTAILKSLIFSIIDFYQLKEKSIIAAEKFHKENNMTNYIDVFENILIENASPL